MIEILKEITLVTVRCNLSPLKLVGARSRLVVLDGFAHECEVQGVVGFNAVPAVGNVKRAILADSDHSFERSKAFALHALEDLCNGRGVRQWSAVAWARHRG